ncbi:MAG: LuxR C-terminal-related transcriptional regulator, partial [Candidatus Nanopelagicales bacterium]
AAFQCFVTGELAPGAGWAGRVHSCLENCTADCVVRGFILVPEAVQLLEGGDAKRALLLFSEATAIGDKFGDPTLLALGRLGEGSAYTLTGEVERGLRLLDEVMVSITAREVLPNITGIVYCATIIACREVFDVRRAHEWTRALSAWCEEQQDLVPFRGECLVHRAELMHIKGAWSDALREVRLARERLSDPPNQSAIGMAYYEEGDLLRVRGELAQAEKVLQHAHELGHESQPALALLWLQQGRTSVAVSAINTSLAEQKYRPHRARLLGAAVEIHLAADQVSQAREQATELTEIAHEIGAPLLLAMSAQHQGAIELAMGSAEQALAMLRQAWKGWQSLGAPYEAARVRVLIGRALTLLGQRELAEMEFDAARTSFQSVGAAFDLVTLETTSDQEQRPAVPLTNRETEVLRLLATGATNRKIAVALVISEKTVARHVSNIYAKLDVSSRSAATAYAYEHNLTPST